MLRFGRAIARMLQNGVHARDVRGDRQTGRHARHFDRARDDARRRGRHASDFLPDCFDALT